MINILIVDDHLAVSEGTKMMIEQEEDMTADNVTDTDLVLDIIKEDRYDLYLVDLFMPKINGIELTKLILKANSDAIVLIYTGFDIGSHYNILIEAGVSGFISKTSTREQLITAIRSALREEAVIPVQLLKQLKRVGTVASQGERIQDLSNVSLSKKEQLIMEGVSKGLTNRKIAEGMYMSQRSVEYSLTKIFSKLGVESRTEALMKVNELGLLNKVLSK